MHAKEKLHKPKEVKTSTNTIHTYCPREEHSSTPHNMAATQEYITATIYGIKNEQGTARVQAKLQSLRSEKKRLAAEVAGLDEANVDLELKSGALDYELEQLKDLRKRAHDDDVDTCRDKHDAQLSTLHKLHQQKRDAVSVLQNVVHHDCGTPLASAIEIATTPLLSSLKEGGSELCAKYKDFVAVVEDGTMPHIRLAESLLGDLVEDESSAASSSSPRPSSSTVPDPRTASMMEALMEVDLGLEKATAIIHSLASDERVQRIVLVAGRSTSGKSTFLNVLRNPDDLVTDKQTLQARSGSEAAARELSRSGWVVWTGSEDYDVYEMGNLVSRARRGAVGGGSTTLFPNVYLDVSAGTAYVDIAGWGDSRGESTRLLEDAILSGLLQTGKVCRMLLVVKYGDLIDGSGALLTALHTTVSSSGMVDRTTLLVSHPCRFLELDYTKCSYDEMLEEVRSDPDLVALLTPMAGLEPANYAARHFFSSLLSDALVLRYHASRAAVLECMDSVKSIAASSSECLPGDTVALSLSSESAQFLSSTMASLHTQLLQLDKVVAPALNCLIAMPELIEEAEMRVATAEARLESALEVLKRVASGDLDSEMEKCNLKQREVRIERARVGRKLEALTAQAGTIASQIVEIGRSGMTVNGVVASKRFYAYAGNRRPEPFIYKGSYTGYTITDAKGRKVTPSSVRVLVSKSSDQVCVYSYFQGSESSDPVDFLYTITKMNLEYNGEVFD